MRYLPLLQRLHILTKDLQVVKFQPNWAQRRYIAEIERQQSLGKPVRIIVLKARQLGISTATEAVMFSQAFLQERMRGLVVAHEIDGAQHLLGMHELFWEKYAFKRLYKPKYESKNEKSWEPTKSHVKIATAKNATAGRSQTIHFLHASEYAFWLNAKETMLALRQTIPTNPHTFIIIESTANGVGNSFYLEWQAAEAGDSDYVPLFFPWWLHPEYTASYIRLPHASLGRLDPEERTLYSMGVSEDRLAWRRWAIRNLTGNDINTFHQEYPSTAEEAFIASGTNVFPIGKLRAVYEPMEGERGRLTRDGNRVRFQPDIAGPLTVFRWPSKDRSWGSYFVSGDPTRTLHNDPACAQVFNRRTLEQVAVWHGRIDPGSFGDELAKLGKYYNDAVITTEITGPGYATIGRLQGMDYPYLWRHAKPDMEPGTVQPNYGWNTTEQSKNAAIGWLLKVLVDGDIVIHHKLTFSEMRDYVTLEGGGYGPANSDGHDDTVTSFAIGIACHFMETPVQAYAGHTPGSPQDDTPHWMTWGQQEQEI